jgi:hypothetical protein
MPHRSDLAHHLMVVQSVRSELVAYKTHFGPIPKTPQSSTTNAPIPASQDSTPAAGTAKLLRAGSVSVSGSSSRHDRPRDSDRHRHRERDRERDRVRDKDKDKDKGKEKESTGGERRVDEGKKDGSSSVRRNNGNEASSAPRSEHGGNSRGSDRDRDYKRRR